MKKDSHRVNDESPLDKADYNTESLNKWLIDNTRTPRAPFNRGSILGSLNIENTQPFIEIGQLVTHNDKELIEGSFVLTQYDKALSNLIGLAIHDAKGTVFIGEKGITAFNIGESIRKDIVLYSENISIATKAAETGYQVAWSGFDALNSFLDESIILLNCDELFAGKELAAREMRRLIDDAAKQEKDRSLKLQHIYSLDEIKYSSDKTAAEILEQLNAENDPFKCAQLAYAYTFKCLPSIPYKESLKSVRAKIEGKLNGVMLDLIFERAQWGLDKNKAQALKAITIHDTKQHRHLVINNFDELNDLNYKGVILVKAPTGKGKTQKVGKPFADWCMGGNLPFLAIAHRTSLISELSSRLNTSHYEDEKKTYELAKKAGRDVQGSINSLAVCINSLDSEAFSKFIRSVKYLFIDEVTQALEAFNSDTSFVTSKEKTFDRLKQLIANADCLIVADANINQDTLTFIESCRPNERFNIVEIKPKNEKKIVYIHPDKESVIDKIVRDIKGQDKKVWLACDSAERARDANRVINGNHNINSFLITRNTTKSKAKKFLDSIDQESKKYQAIIASPTISSGVSVEHRDANGITLPHFDYVSGILTGHSVTSRDAYQMLGRVRYAKELHLFIDQKFMPCIDAETKLEAWQHLSGENGTSLTDLIATIQANNEMDKTRFANNLYYLLEYYGFEIRRAEYSVNAAIEKELKEARKEIKEADKNGILNAKPITEEIANKYRKSLDLTDAEVYELSAYDKRMQLNLPFDAVLTEQDLDVNIAQVIRYNAVFGHHKAVSDKTTDIALRDYTKQAGDIFKGIFKELNIKGGAIFSDSQARSVLRRIEPHQTYLAAIGFIPKSFAQKKETKTAVKRLKLLLEHFGIKTDGKRIDNPALRKKSDTLSILSIDKMHEVSENDGAKVYRIDGSSIEKMEQLADRYAIKTKTIELKTVSEQQQDKEPSNESPYFADMRFDCIDPDDNYWQAATI